MCSNWAVKKVDLTTKDNIYNMEIYQKPLQRLVYDQMAENDS